MKWSGKLVGGALGLAFGPVGVALGVLAGHFYDEKAGAGEGGQQLALDLIAIGLAVSEQHQLADRLGVELAVQLEQTA